MNVAKRVTQAKRVTPWPRLHRRCLGAILVGNLLWGAWGALPAGADAAPSTAAPSAAAPSAATPSAAAPSAATAVAAGGWRSLEPVPFGDAQLYLPASWTVVGPGTDICGVPRVPSGPGPVPGVVLLGSFGSSAWCGPGTGTAARAVSNLVRLGPLPGSEPPYRADPKIVRNGVTLYEVVLHGPISGTAYLVPSLGVELMVTGPEAPRVLDSISASVRQRALAVLTNQTAATEAPNSWPRTNFAGLRFAVPPGWAINRTAYANECDLFYDGGSSSAAVVANSAVFDTDTNNLFFPCPLALTPRAPVNGLVVHQGSKKAPNSLPSRGLAITVNGVHGFVDPSNLLGVLVVVLELPGRALPVQVSIGLGNALTAQRILASITRA